MIKYLFQIDYPPGQRTEYLDWTGSMATAIQAPEEIRRIRSYENVVGASPHRVVELEFDSAEDAARYFDGAAMKIVMEGLLSRAANVKVSILRQRGDYTKG